VSRFLGRLETSQYAPPAALEALRMAKLRGILAQAYDHTPFYRRRFDAAGVAPADIRTFADLAAIPPLTKTDILRHLDDLLARNVPPDERHRSATGGSTGEHTPFYRDNASVEMKEAAQYRFYRWTGWDRGEKTAVVWPALQDLGARGVRGRLRDLMLDRTLLLPSGRLNDETLDAHARALAAYRPRLLRGMPNPLALVTRRLRESVARPPRPSGVLTMGEPLLPVHRDLFRSVYGAPVFNCYVSRECGHMASECEAHEGLHVNAESLHLEFIAGQGAAPPGTPGKILVTDLENRAMPFLRYEIGDVGTPLAGPCPCGRTLPRMAMDAGRVTDFVISPRDGARISGVTLCHYLLAEGRDVGQLQIIQDERDHLTIRVRQSPSRSPERDLSHAAGVLDRIFEGSMRFTFVPVERIEREPSGKYRFCINALPEAAAF
jgi:phenylacetate-CoA ligase